MSTNTSNLPITFRLLLGAIGLVLITLAIALPFQATCAIEVVFGAFFATVPLSIGGMALHLGYTGEDK